MDKNSFPSTLVGRKLNWCNVSRQYFNSARYEGTEDDERRLFYVSITRPRDMLAITHISGKESSFLGDLCLKSFGDINLKFATWGRSNINKSTLQEFTPTEIIWYKECPYMYRMRNNWGFQPGLKEEIGFGNAMHSVLRNAVRLVKEEGINPVTAIKEASDRFFYLPFAGTSTFHRLKKKSEDILDNFVKSNPEFLLSAEEVEYRIIYNNGKATVSGRADVILSNNGKYVVADYKTNRGVNTRDEVEIQLGAYTSGLKRSKINVELGKIAYLEECEVDDVNLDENKSEEIDSKINDLIDGIESNRFNPIVGEQCVDCDMKKLCRYGGNNE